jgi:hypothetical protein
MAAFRSFTMGGTHDCDDFRGLAKVGTGDNPDTLPAVEAHWVNPAGEIRSSATLLCLLTFDAFSLEPRGRFVIYPILRLGIRPKARNFLLQPTFPNNIDVPDLIVYRCERWFGSLFCHAARAPLLESPLKAIMTADGF